MTVGDLRDLKYVERTQSTRGVEPPHHHNVGRGARPAGSPERAAIFTSDSIKDILRNPRFAGRVPLRDGRVVAGTFPPLIDAETFEKCERIRESQRFRPLRGPGAGPKASEYLLSGLLRCAACGSTMRRGAAASSRTSNRRPPTRTST